MLDLKTEFETLRKEFDDVVSWLEEEYLQLQANKIFPQMLDGIKVEAYDTKTELNQLASITVENAKTLAVRPYDKSIMVDIENALRKNDLKLSLSVAQESVFCSIPMLTQERKDLLTKTIKERLEKAKHSIKTIRESCIGKIKKALSDKDLSEDESFTAKKDLQDEIEKINERLKHRCDNKLNDINS